jgi:hypothetical protein
VLAGAPPVRLSFDFRGRVCYFDREVRHKSEDIDDKVLMDTVKAIARCVRAVNLNYDIPYIAGYSKRRSYHFYRSRFCRNHSAFWVEHIALHVRFGNSDLITVANPPNDKYQDSE